MTATQAPTPGPLSAESAGPYSCMRCDNSTWNDDDICDQCVAEDCAPENAIDWPDAPTAPVEASGSEREISPAYRSKLIAECEERIRNGNVLGAVPMMTVGAQTLLAALRPQPSGETREAVAEIIEAAIVRHDPRRDVEGTLDDADDILALLSASPLALGGQYSGGELARQIELLRKASEVPVPDDDSDFTIERARRGSESWRTLARNTVAAFDSHPSPPPAADEDRVRELESEATHLRDTLLGIAESDHYRRYPKQHEDGGVRGQSGLRAVRALTGQHGSYINDDEVRRLDAEKRAALKSTAAKEGEKS